MPKYLNFLLETEGGIAAEPVRLKLIQFYENLVEENRLQNLTRLSSPEDFFYGHVIDVLELFKTQWMQPPCLDLGSGGGVPGLLASLLGPEKWILTDSELKKAEYLERAIRLFGIEPSVEVFAGRAEDYLKKGEAQTIIARAVGPVDRIYSWIRKCSTWNNLILFKGPSWDEEWAKFQGTKWCSELSVLGTHEYVIGNAGPQQKSRKLILLKRK